MIPFGIILQAFKTATSVLMNADGQFIDFGFSAEDKYEKEVETTDGRPNMSLFRHFKLCIHQQTVGSECLSKLRLTFSTECLRN